MSVYPSLRIIARHARITVESCDIDEIDASGLSTIKTERGLELRPQKTCCIRVPEGTNLTVSSESGEIQTMGHLGRIAITTESGRISIESAESVDVRSISGRVSIAECIGECRVHSDSGKIELTKAGSVNLSTRSGRVNCGCIKADAVIRNVSGRVNIGSLGQGDIDVEVISGRIDVEIPRDTRPQISADSEQGRVTCNVHQGQDFTINVKSATGRVSIAYQ